ncbi:MAG: hypothetical protein JW904_06520 [Spirochaetales bacterium]|nr:hypothetical protein [Spirochaetales bacterium]
MKQLFVWAGIFIVFYAGLAAGTHFTRATNAKKILLAIDVSGTMESEKQKLSGTLSFLEQSPYVQYKIVTNSPNMRLQLLQDWSSVPDFGAVSAITMYVPLSLEKLAGIAGQAGADEIIFITNAADTSALRNIPDSRIITP